MKLTVTLPNHSYELWIKKGAIQQVGNWIASIWAPQKIAIITDENVCPLYAKQVIQQLEKNNFIPFLITVPAGETSNSLHVASKIYHSFAEFGLTRSDGIIALGGGVVGDLAGFVASTYMRGCHFLQIPTTLLAQVDSSIGGKTAINTEKAKNLIGTFSQPDGVLIDPDTLKTLDIRYLREGMAEIIKSAAIADENFWLQLANLKNESEFLQQAENMITTSCQIKKQAVENDEFDHGTRLLLNFGHTIGHALENVQGYGQLAHGEAVAIGMCQVTQVSEEKGLTETGTYVKLKAMIEKFHLPNNKQTYAEEKLFQAIVHDKKIRGDNIQLVILEKIGKAKILSLPINNIKEYLKRKEN